MGEYGLYDYDVTIIKRLGKHFIKLTNLSACRKAGLVVDREYSPKGSVNNIKLENNLSRAKSNVLDLSLSNPWKYFCTFTIDKEKCNRYDFKAYYKAFSKFVSNYNRYLPDDEKVKYLFIPERHIDGAWHIHGILNNIPEKDIFINKNGYLSWKKYAEKFGFMSFSEIKDIDACSLYLLKYITKDMCRSISELGGHLYYASNGLRKAEIDFKGKVRLKNCNWDYETKDGYCRIKTIDTRYQNFDEMVELIHET